MDRRTPFPERGRPGRRWILLAALLAGFSVYARADEALLDRWFAAQEEIRSWSASFTQTRTLKALKEPLTTEGKVWFSEPNRFRWELGNPVQTIAVREPDTLIILYPRLKRAERLPLNGRAAGPWRDALTLLEAGFPRSRQEMNEQFQLEGVEENGDEVQVDLKPRSPQARKMIASVLLVFGRTGLELRATELRFVDGSRMRNDFSGAVKNPAIDDSRFVADIPEDFKVTQPAGAEGR